MNPPLEYQQVLLHYLAISSEQELFAIFPDIREMAISEHNHIPFLVARYAIERGVHFHQAFGFNTLYEMMRDPVTVRELEQKYGFSYHDLIHLTGSKDVYHFMELASRNEMVAMLQRVLNRIKSIISWQKTNPLRFFAQLARSPKALFTELRCRTHVTLRTDDYSVQVPFGYPAVEWKSAPILAVICHVFYVDMVDEFIRYFSNIPFQFDLYITTDTQEKRAKLEKIFSHWKGIIEVRLAPNRGRDIAPKLITCRDVYDRYEYILHIHTKKSPHRRRLRGWRFHLLETLLGSTEIVESVFEAFRSSPNLGIIAPQHFEAIHKTVGWGRNFKIAQTLAHRMGILISPNGLIDFPSGSMFWARSAAIRPLLNCNLAFDEFPDETGQLDKTLGHAIERLFFFSCERAGYGWIKISRPNLLSTPRSGKFIASHDDLINFICNCRHKLIE